MDNEISNQVGHEIYQFLAELYPICRSITGHGVRETLQGIARHVPVKVQEIPSGTEVFDWVVPQEWNIQDAYIKNKNGERIVDFNQSNLHVVSYSQPIHTTMTLEELKPHLYSLPENPDWIPYRTSYYKESWGFCLTHRQLMALKDEEYEVCINSTLESGHLTYGEYIIKGKTEEEILISCHTCHPSLCNDNLSGIAVTTFLAKTLSGRSLRYSYRFLFIPGTIGSITWLALHETQVSTITNGMVVTGVGDPGPLTYKKSRQGNAGIDRAFTHILKTSGLEHAIIDFFPYGYDERQYCSPGFNLPVGCFMRTPHGEYPEYHTSGDNLAFVQPQPLEESLICCLRALNILERNKTFLSQNPKCEPRLGKRGLYRAIGGESEGAKREMAMLWVLNLSDGMHSLLDIAERSGLEFESIDKAAESLEEHGLLKEVSVTRPVNSPN